MSRLLRPLASRVAVRLTFAVSCALACVISVVGVRIVMTEEVDLRAAVVAEMLLLTRSVEVAFENAIRDRQLGDVQETLTELEAIDPRIDIYVLGPHGAIIARSRGAPRPPPVASDGEVHFVPARSANVRLAATHVSLQGPLPGVDGLLIARPLDDIDADLAHTRLQVLVTALLSIVASALLLLLGARRFVEQPLARMIDAMRRFREDGSVALSGPFRADEVGNALKEFSALARELEAARERIQREQEARALLEGRLQRLDKLATVGQLSAGLAHEVGSPLQVLEGRLAALKRHLARDEKAVGLLEIALEQTRRITRVVAQLLAFARPAPAVLRSIDPREPAQNVVDFLELEARRRGVDLESDLTRGPGQMVLDPDHVSQLVLNLVRNALEAAARGGRVRVVSEQAQGSGAWLLSVEDTGPGIAASQQERIFEPFFTTRGESGGTGLGLAVVRALVDRYGGRVSVHSELGRGARFEVEIPLRQEVHSQDRERAGTDQIAADRR